MDRVTDCPKCGTAVERVFGAIVVFNPPLEFTTCTNCGARLVRPAGGAWSENPDAPASPDSGNKAA